MMTAVRHHPGPRLQPRRTTPAPGGPSGPSTSTLTAPCGNACPAGEDVRGLAAARPRSGEAGYEPAWRRIMEVNPFPAVMGRVCYHPCETACNRGHARRGRRHQLRRALPRRRGDPARAGGSRSTVPPTGRGCWSWVRDRPDCPRRTTWRSSATRSPCASPRPRAGGHDALRHPALPSPARRARRRGRPSPRPRGRPAGRHRRDRPRGDAARGRWDAAFLAVGAQLGRRTYLPAGAAARIIDAVRMLHALEEGDPPLLGPTGGCVRRREHRHGRRPHGPAAGRRGRGRRLSTHAETGCRPTPSEVSEAEEEGVRFTWLSTIDPGGARAD